jgi:hypothetical protein
LKLCNWWDLEGGNDPAREQFPAGHGVHASERRPISAPVTRMTAWDRPRRKRLRKKADNW